MRFVDEAKIRVKAGSGGSGIVAWRREKFVPLGGPAGGNGGKGGDVVFVAKEGMNSLLDLKRQWLIEAEDGEKGQRKNQAGRKGNDKIIYVPVGTIVKMHSESIQKTYDLTTHQQRVLVCRGGIGGFGNAHFKSSYDNAPQKATLGEEGEAFDVELTLKLMADVGLLGFPNAGKSTVLAALSNARPKIADYPFTTLQPMVGVCEISLDTSMVIADIPGLIEGASEGLGLGMRFLRHLERVRVLCHVIDAVGGQNLVENFNVINAELHNYSQSLASLPQLVAINKMDAVDDDATLAIQELETYLKTQKIEYVRVSAATHDGLNALRDKLFSQVLQKADKGVGQAKVFDPAKNLY